MRRNDERHGRTNEEQEGEIRHRLKDPTAHSHPTNPNHHTYTPIAIPQKQSEWGGEGEGPWAKSRATFNPFRISLSLSSPLPPSLSFSPSLCSSSLSLYCPRAITLKLAWPVLIQISLTMRTSGNHVSVGKPHKNAQVQFPVTLPMHRKKEEENILKATLHFSAAWGKRDLGC